MNERSSRAAFSSPCAMIRPSSERSLMNALRGMPSSRVARTRRWPYALWYRPAIVGCGLTRTGISWPRCSIDCLSNWNDASSSSRNRSDSGDGSTSWGSISMAANADFNWPRRYSFSLSISVNVSFTERTLPADTLGIIGCALSAGENAGCRGGEESVDVVDSLVHRPHTFFRRSVISWLTESTDSRARSYAPLPTELRSSS